MGAWLVGETTVIRGLAATAAAAAVVGAFLMRRWDRGAGRRVAELASAGARAELTYEERIAELEADVGTARESRAALNTKLRAKRAELARLRNEHAVLLRRYATAETERARALESRRRLELQAAAPARSLPSVGPHADPDTRGQAPRGAHPSSGVDAMSPDRLKSDQLTADAYARAGEALRRLSRNARDQRGRAQNHHPDQERQRGQDRQQSAPEESRPAERPLRSDRDHSCGQGAEGADPQRRPGGRAPAREPAQTPRPATRASVSAPQAAPRSAPQAAVPPAHDRTAATAVVPYATARQAAVRAAGGFDYFGAQQQPRKRPARPDPRPVSAELPDEDLADVIGAEVLAARAALGAVGAVIDLTAHDETEQLDVAELRSAISS